MSRDPEFLPLPSFQARGGFFKRIGGISQGFYGSLNCGWGSNDSPGDVTTNRALVLQSLGGEVSDLLTAFQVHSNRVHPVTNIWTREKSPEVDALVTDKPGIALGILTADCAPVLFEDATHQVIGAAHAGWKGAIAGVLENTVTSMEKLGAERSHIKAAIGPCIHQISYEVDDGFYQTFLNQDPGYADFFAEGQAAGKYQFDLPGFVEGRLNALGLNSVLPSLDDTYVKEDDYFSFRRTTHRGEPDYGRQISVIALEG